MSHIVTIKTEVRDATAVELACARLRLEAPQAGAHELFNSAVTGLAVKLPGWVYPLVCNVASGSVHYDNYGGRWGEAVQLDRFLQAYAVEKAGLEARKRGHQVTEQTLPDGSIKLVIQLAGGAT